LFGVWSVVFGGEGKMREPGHKPLEQDKANIGRWVRDSKPSDTAGEPIIIPAIAAIEI